ncbi:hypothetical protein [Bradyrhizobium diazoefficiens]|uniref:hypothetical protein n=1 Tax=Bradyrhizobium diazoefficiens TaxID=1355477 RepID=UPI00272AF368|nr:hypothetical protein [Bradyrhizobium diazoefficiens]WLA58519.1 hypothetical protein QIH81_07620 [Bradyrhizobium diazoefficiens]
MTRSRAPLPTDRTELGQALEDAFAGRVTIGVPELATLIPMHRETIARHIAAGNLVGRLKGLGRTRRHRFFTIADVMRFLRLMADETRTLTPAPSNVGDLPIRLQRGMRMTLPSKRRSS